jgi:hypothetical protein
MGIFIAMGTKEAITPARRRTTCGALSRSLETVVNAVLAAVVAYLVNGYLAGRICSDARLRRTGTAPRPRPSHTRKNNNAKQSPPKDRRIQ